MDTSMGHLHPLDSPSSLPLYRSPYPLSLGLGNFKVHVFIYLFAVLQHLQQPHSFIAWVQSTNMGQTWPAFGFRLELASYGVENGQGRAPKLASRSFGNYKLHKVVDISPFPFSLTIEWIIAIGDFGHLMILGQLSQAESFIYKLRFITRILGWLF